MDATAIAVLMPRIRAAQRAEITEFVVYRSLAERARQGANREILRRIGEDERRHHDFWQRHTGAGVRPHRLRVCLYLVLARALGVTFALKLMERGEEFAQHEYEQLRGIPGVDRIIEDEEAHERRLLDMLHDEPLAYTGSIVLGLNDALVELTGALAGLTLAFAQSRLVAIAGLITGIAASLSMAASEYLSAKSELAAGAAKTPLKSAAYTGFAYLLAVVLLILPFFTIGNVYVALLATLSVAVLVVAFFSFYISVARDVPFWPRFLEMIAISFGVSAVTFVIGWGVRTLIGVEV